MMNINARSSSIAKFAVKAAVVGALALTVGCSDDGDDNGSNSRNGSGGDGGGVALGSTLTVNAPVYLKYWDWWDGGDWIGEETYTPFDETMAVTALWWGDDCFNESVGSITNGQLSFVIDTPPCLEDIVEFFGGGGKTEFHSMYDDINISPSGAKAMRFELMGNNGISIERARLSSGATYEHIEYMYVDRDVAVSAKGKTDYSTRSFTLNLKKGWNVMSIKYEWSSDRNMDTRIQSLSNPSNIRWIAFVY